MFALYSCTWTYFFHKWKSKSFPVIHFKRNMLWLKLLLNVSKIISPGGIVWSHVYITKIWSILLFFFLKQSSPVNNITTHFWYRASIPGIGSGNQILPVSTANSGSDRFGFTLFFLLCWSDRILFSAVGPCWFLLFWVVGRGFDSYVLGLGCLDFSKSQNIFRW